ncbi:MAG: apolipoprotein N-acyltransferase [Armatimonadetes bacterium]|nr:apolipoprotein N-acyltransferase [Armatimonadota bacterium]
MIGKTFIPLLWILNLNKKGFIWGYILGLSFFGTILNWFALFGREPYLLGVLFYSIFWGFAAWLICLYYKKTKNFLKRILFVPSLWVIFEYLKSLGPLGFNWGTLCYSQYKFSLILPIVNLIGGFGLSWLIVFINAWILELILLFYEKKKFNFKYLSPFLILCLILFYGFYNLNFRKSSKFIKVSLIQLNIDQDIKWSKSYFNKTIEIIEELINKAAKNHSQLVILPETAFPDYMLYDLELTKRVGNLAKKNKIYLVSGAPDYELKNKQAYIYNTVMVFGPQGEYKGKYQKNHLVPFGEYLPLGKYLKKYSLFKRVANFSKGDKLNIFFTKIGSFGSLICFESTFPHLARTLLKQADFWIVATNDAWFSFSSASEHHLALSITRAVENGVYLAFNANTGISALVDPQGRIIKSTSLFERKILSGDLGLKSKNTLYNLLGDYIVYLSFILVLVLFFKKEK